MNLWRFSNPDPEKLAKAAIKILEKIERYKKAARRRCVEMFSIEKMTDKNMKVFEKTSKIAKAASIAIELKEKH